MVVRKATGTKAAPKRTTSKAALKTAAPAKKAAAPKTAAPKTVARPGRGRRGEGGSIGSQVAKLRKAGQTFPQIAEEVGLPALEAARAYRNLQQPTFTGTDAVLGKKIVALRDRENVPWSPDLWAETGLSIDKLHGLYEAASGKSWTESGTGAESKPKRGRPKKTAAPAPVEDEASAPKASAPKRTAKASAPAAEAKAPSTRAGMLALVQDEGTTPDAIRNMLEGKTVEITYEMNGVKAKPFNLLVKIVKKVGKTKSGRAIDFSDEDGKRHVVSLAAITAVK